MTWPILPPTLQPKLDMFFWYSSARIWLIFKMDTHMDGSVLAVLTAYQNNLVTSKMMTSQVAQWFPTSTSGKYNSWRKRVKLNYRKSFIMTNLTRLRLILVDLSGLMKKGTHLKQNVLFFITLYRQRFSLRKTHFLPLKQFLKCYDAKCH